jgi:hypothetical protein
MVKHHVKSKKKKSPKTAEPVKSNEELLKELDRFAGSSEEDEDGPNAEDTDDESVSSVEESRQMKTLDGEEADESSLEEENDASSDEDEYGVASAPKPKKKKASRDDSDDDSDADSDDDMQLVETSHNGMAGAMAKILGLATSNIAKQTKAVVLSKTITPLQKQQKKEKEEFDALKLKRKQRREVNLTALHIPLSAATSRPISGKDKSSDLIAKAMAQEIEVESMHRRVATRGVVALFNTIAQHQQQKANDQVRRRPETADFFIKRDYLLTFICRLKRV